MKSSSGRSLLRSFVAVSLILGFAVTLLMLPGCGAKRSTPEKAAKAYVSALQDADWDGMLECCAPEVRGMLEQMGKEMGGGKKAMERQSRGMKIEKFKVLSSKVKGDWADVEVSLTAKGKQEKETLTLHKIEGEWLLDIPRLDKGDIKALKEEIKEAAEEDAPEEKK